MLTVTGPSLRDYVPRKPWHRHEATEKQLGVLTRYGFEVLRPLTKGEAASLICQCNELENRYPTPATQGQRDKLIRHGRWRPGTSKRDATRMITALQMGARR
jgi:hypothetical protein